MKILIADDDDLALRILRRYLEQWGHEVTHALDGQEAWALFEQHEFPMVISDWMMPRMDGLELIRRIRNDERGRYVYTILITARSDKEDLVHGMEAGADDFVSKPFDRDELRVRVREGERIVGLERALAEGESSKEQSLRRAITSALSEAEDDLQRAIAELDAVNGQAAGALRDRIDRALQELAHARQALASLRAACPAARES